MLGHFSFLRPATKDLCFVGTYGEKGAKTIKKETKPQVVLDPRRKAT